MYGVRQIIRQDGKNFKNIIMKKLLLLITILIPIFAFSQSGGKRDFEMRLIPAIGGGVQLMITDNYGKLDVQSLVPQTLTGTTPTWNIKSGIDAKITLSGNTSITLTNIYPGAAGTLYITNAIAVYKVKFVGYSCSIKGPDLIIDSSGIECSGSSKEDSFTWKWDGVRLKIHVAKDYTQITW